MRPAEVTNEQIIEAGKQLIAAGRSITGFALRKITKSGDANRLKKIWDDYQITQSVTASEPVAELPVEIAEQMTQVSRALVDKIHLIAIELNDKAVKASERRVAELVRTTSEQRQQAERELADASETVNDLEKQLDEKETEIELLTKRLDTANHLSQAQSVELAQLKERLIAAETNAKKEAEHSANQIAKLADEKQELTEVQEILHKKLEDAKAELADKKADIKHMQANVLSVTDKNDALLSELLMLKNNLTEKNTVLMLQNADIEKMNTQLALKTVEWQEAEKQVAVVQESFARVSGQLEIANAQNAALLDTIKDGKTKKN